MKARNFLPIAIIVLSVVLAAAGCGPDPSGSPTPPVMRAISGSYDVSGTNLDGRPYTGRITIAFEGDNRYGLRWTIGDGSHKGSGTLNGDTLTSTWDDGTLSGDVTYVIQPDGSLSGTWTQDGQSGTGTETLTPRK